MWLPASIRWRTRALGQIPESGWLAATVVGGTPGSFWQVQTNLQLISNPVDSGTPFQAASMPLAGGWVRRLVV